jgi:hypothetical protein
MRQIWESCVRVVVGSVVFVRVEDCINVKRTEYILTASVHVLML